MTPLAPFSFCIHPSRIHLITRISPFEWQVKYPRYRLATFIKLTLIRNEILIKFNNNYIYAYTTRYKQRVSIQNIILLKNRMTLFETGTFMNNISNS